MKTPILAWAALAVNAVVILQGAVVRATGSGAGCGRDWPRCQGSFLPLQQGIATWIEYSHRALSLVALLMGIWLLARALRMRKELPGFLPWTLVSCGFLVVEALIGAGTVLTGLTGENVSVARGLLVAFHLLNSLLLMGALALATVHAYPGHSEGFGWSGLTRLNLLMIIGLLGMMMVMFSGGIAAMGNTMFPSESLQSGLAADFDASSHPLIRIRILHPFLALGVGACLWVSFALSVKLRPMAQVRKFRAILAGVFGLQLLVGTVNLALLGPIFLQLLHLALAIAAFALWAVVTWYTLNMGQSNLPAESLEI